MPRKGENIYKRKDGRWEGRFIKGRNLEGKALYGYLYAKSYREIKTKMAQADKIDDNQVKMMNQDKQAVPFQIVAQEWFISVQPHVKESSSVKYENMLKNYILPSLGDKYIQSFSYEVLESFCNELSLTGGHKGTGLSPKTVSDILSLIRTILQYSANKGIVPPCDAHSVIIKQQPKEMRILSRNEQKKLCQYLYSNLNERNVGILICLFTGLRVGEICALKWEDISLSERTIHVHQTLQRIQSKSDPKKKTKILISTPKSSCSIRTIPLPDELVKILFALKTIPSAYVLTGKTDRYLEPRTMQNHFKKVLKNCYIENANYHALRHTFATRCIELGFDIKSLSEILGHASVNITMNRYVHPSMEMKRKNMERLSELITVR